MTEELETSNLNEDEEGRDRSTFRCVIGLHDWTPWGEPTRYTLSRGDHQIGFAYCQERHCRRCNLSKHRIERRKMTR